MAKSTRKSAKRANQTTKPGKARKQKSATPAARRICNLVPSKSTELDWSYRDALGSGALAAPAAPPPSKDLRAAWWNVGDQKNTGSCVGWAAADGLARYHLVQTGILPNSELLSPRFVWMASKETDEFVTRAETFIEEAGTSLKAALDILRKFGAVTMSDLPFHIDTTMYAGDENTFYAGAAQRKIASYFNLHKDLGQWRTWLATKGPILAGLSVDSSWENASAANGGNIDVFMPNTVRGGHAVTIVGYTASGRFIVRNSWGTEWGDGGFGYVTEAYIVAGFFNESYGVTL